MVFDTDIWKVVLAAVVYFALGWVWYSPVLFAKPWMKALGKHPTQVGMEATSMVTTFVAILVLVLAQAYVMSQVGIVDVLGGAYLGAVLGVGFVATTALINSVFQGFNRNLFLIDHCYHVLGIILAGAILAV